MILEEGANRLLERYKKRLAVSEEVYKMTHDNKTMSESLKLTVAQVLKNSSTFLTEAFGSNTEGTQRADMGTFKKFTLNITNTVLPNLIAPELVLTKPMSAITGYIQYIEFVAGSNKGGIEQGRLLNNPFQLGEMDEERVNYTAQAVVEMVRLDAEGIGQLAWTPINEKFIPAVVGAESGVEVEIVDAKKGLIKVTGEEGEVKIKYLYDNVYIPQNDIPSVSARVRGIALEAKPRRVQIYYSQIAAFQAKQELNMDLGAQLSSQAVSEISYEIDTEVVQLLDAMAGKAELVFNKRQPVGVSKAEHYEGFAEVISKASQIVYDRTKKYAANILVVHSSLITMFDLMRGWKPVAKGAKAGPYYAGNLNGLKVFVSPAMLPGRFIALFNGDDMMTSPAVFAPYMVITPTQLLGFADGGMNQGYSTLYDLKPLNPLLVVGGQVIDEADANLVQPLAIVGE